jgi:hypothetical protein
MDERQETMRAGLSVLVCFAISACGDLGPRTDGSRYTGEFSGPLVWTTASRVSCVSTYAVTGKIQIDLEQSGNNVTGEGDVELTETPGPVSPQECGPAPNRSWGGGGRISGTTSTFSFSHQYTASGVLVETSKATLAGTVSSGVINGTLTVNHSGTGTIGGLTTTTGGSGTFNVTLRR